jgi:hypothetical protein
MDKQAYRLTRWHKDSGLALKGALGHRHSTRTMNGWTVLLFLFRFKAPQVQLQLDTEQISRLEMEVMRCLFTKMIKS